MTSDAPKTVPAVENAVKILRYLAQSGRPDGAAGTARATGVNVSSAFNILRTLANEGLVNFDASTKTYAIGMEMLGLAGPLLGMSPVDVITPEMAQIADAHKVMVALWQVTDMERIVLRNSVVSDAVVHMNMRAGVRLPAQVGAVGRCYVAALETDKGKARADFETLRWQVAPKFEDYWADIQACKELGYAADHGNLYRGVRIVAAICCDATGKPRLGLSSINIEGQISAPKLEEVGRSLRVLADRIEGSILKKGSAE